MNRTIVIGDIHGCYDELVELLELLRFGNEDRVVAVGDLTVKGPKDRAVVDLFCNDSRFTSVIGNHDLALVRHWRGENVYLRPAQASAFNKLAQGNTRYLEYLASLPFIIELQSHIVVHAGLRPGIPFSEQSVEDLTELRTLGGNPRSREGLPWYEVYDANKVALFGHWPAPRPRRGKRAIGLDTGCVYGDFLTAYVLETNSFMTVPAHQAYRPHRDHSEAPPTNESINLVQRTRNSDLPQQNC
jgi:diadenosine tetraphosphatase ApaH/serine/threonine PP2A family protein phosphatase